MSPWQHLHYLHIFQSTAFALFEPNFGRLLSIFTYLMYISCCCLLKTYQLSSRFVPTLKPTGLVCFGAKPQVDWQSASLKSCYLATKDPDTCASYTNENGISHNDGWKRFKNLVQRDKHDLSCIASPEGEIKSTFSWTSFYRIHRSSTLCFGEPTLGKLNQLKFLCSSTSSTLSDPILAKLNHMTLSSETEFCITMHIPLYDLVVHTGTTFSVPISHSETNRVSD